LFLLAVPALWAAIAQPSTAAVAAPPPADIVVGSAVKKARAEGKTVLIEFGASWCVWCRRFDAFVKAPDTAPIIAANYVVVNLTVLEHDDKKALEHPGGQMRMSQWGGEKSGLPFYVFLDATGQKIANSNAMPNGDNIGFPAVPEEVHAFMALIDQTARKMTGPQRATLEAYLLRVMPPPAPQ
jgi:thiol:disulfide interchange protein